MQRRTFSIRLLALLSSLGFAVNARAKTAPANIDPAGYLVSEKLEGVRAVWDGKVLRFRIGRTVAAPAWFIAKLPKEPPAIHSTVTYTYRDLTPSGKPRFASFFRVYDNL